MIFESTTLTNTIDEYINPIIIISVLDISKIDRNTGAKSFETLATEGLLLKDYFIITNTHRPILYYAKVLLTNDDGREKLSKKLRIYNIQVSDYIEVSRSIGVQIPSQLSTIGTELLMKFPDSNIYQTSATTTRRQSYNASLSSTSLSDNISSSDSETSIGTNHILTTNQLLPDTADESYKIITTNDILSYLHHFNNNNTEHTEINNINASPELQENDQHSSSSITNSNNESNEAENNDESILTASNTNVNEVNNEPTKLVQTFIYDFFPVTNNIYTDIADIDRNTTQIIIKSALRHFSTNGKVFDALVSDLSGEIKTVAFNDEADRFNNIIVLNQIISIQNGDVRIANENFTSPYSLYELRLTPTTIINTYKSISFNPVILIRKQDIRNIHSILHGSYIGISKPRDRRLTITKIISFIILII
ncbi:unnamed protein product [Rotaria socialis]|uniref:Replication protein A OB domain-containing protein n=1 Tax=Rotaria socialis TaxID=392032 RepID=A0A820BQI3_9BILA|nr:unnamed protein product [Rotaria socialis]